METKACCPNCDHEFMIEIDELIASNVERDVKSKLEAEYRKKMKVVDQTKADMAELQKKMETIEDDARIKALKTLTKKEEEIKKDAEKRATEKANLNLADAMRELKNKEEDLQLLVQKRAGEEVEKARAEEKLKQAELQKQMDDQKKLIEEMQRKAGQGSIQLQGDVQEMAIGEWLRAQFPLDTIEDIKTGVRGADLHQVVNSRTVPNCGSIYYESKRSKDFQKGWIEKFKVDMRARNSTLGVLITEVMPEGMERMGQKEGIWICSLTEFRGLSHALRQAVVMVGETKAANENKGGKMEMVYDYLTGPEFRSRVEAIVEGFVQMKTDLDTERRAMEGLWKKRETQINKVVLNTTQLYSSVKGIAGNSIGKIEALELPAGEADL